MLEPSAVIGGRYSVVQELGKGSYGETYLAKDLHLPGEPICVVKKFSPQNRSHHNLEVGLRLFKKEAETLYRLGKHEQVPQLLAYFLNDDDYNYYLVQEFIEGQDLTEEIKNGLGEAKVVQLLIDILEVLKYIHDANVIHRDIKPSNIRRRIDEKIVLIDFGAVKEVSLLEEEHGQVSYTVAIGTPGYRPSEQANGRPRFVSDIYAVGMIAIQALTKVHPKDLEEDPQTGQILWPGDTAISNNLAEIINKMVRYHFSQRYKSISEVLSELNRLQSSSVDLVAKTREALNFLKDDIRIIRGGIVLPEIRLFLIKKIEHFENLYIEYTESLEDKKLSTFLRDVCKDSDFEVEPDHPAKLVLKNIVHIQRTIHSEESYTQILRSGHRKFKLTSPKRLIEIARQIIKEPIIRKSFTDTLDSISKHLPNIDSEIINNSLLAFWSAGCFETEPEIGLPWKRIWTLKPGFEQSEEDLLEALRDGVKSKLAEALIEIDEEVNDNIINKILP
ncbi:MAG: serine/threonine-protein kinase [Nostoc sp.]|uniref:serine/threonine-protein kinase n=1 Tax=Nostoc sp. TaxID=1180 RepID=UPI002FFC1136